MGKLNNLLKFEFFKSKYNLSNISHALLASLLLSIAFLLTIFLTDNSEVYIFPKLLAIILGVLTIILWISDDSASKISTKKSLYPGLFIAISYILLLEDIGFYLSSFLVFLAILMVYRYKQKSIWHGVISKIVLTTIFITILFLLFTKLLQVRVPMGVFY